MKSVSDMMDEYEGYDKTKEEDWTVGIKSQEERINDEVLDMEISHKVDVGKDEVMKELLQLPEILYNLRDTVIKQEQRLSECTAVRKAVETRVSNDVHSEEGENGKKRFANVQAREVETRKRLDADSDYGVARQNENKARSEMNVTKRDIEYVINRFKAMRTLAPFFQDGK